jgi:hypothetical protein
MIDRIEVRWIGAPPDVFTNIKPNQHIALTEGSSKR